MILRLFRYVLLLTLFCLASQLLAALPPSIAFRPSVNVLDDQTLEVHFSIAEGTYLYRDKFAFSIDSPQVKLGEPLFPPALTTNDETFGTVPVYHQQVRILLPLIREPGQMLPVTLNIASQGCSQAGLCYPVQKHAFDLELPALVAQTPKAPASANNEASRIAGILENENLLWAMASFFGFGLLLSLTPCVFPMFPILSSIIVGARGAEQKISSQRGFILSLAYVLGMALTYTLLGIIAGLTGTLFASALQTPQFLYGSALLLILLALSMFGYYELQFPTTLQNLFSRRLTRVRGGSLPGAALMGMLSTILTSACVAAPLAGALLYISKSANALLGALALFSLAFGMGVPLLLIGLSAGSLLPKSGAWMNIVKRAFGYILIGTAIWIITPVIPPVVMMWAWALLLIILAVHLRAVDPLPPQTGLTPRLGKGIGIVFLLAGGAIFVGALSGSHDPIRPLAVLQASSELSRTKPLDFMPVHTIAELDEKLRDPGRPVMLLFTSPACKACQEMDRYTFADPRVQKLLASWLTLKADVTSFTSEEQALQARFDLYGTPTVLFFDATGREVVNERVVGYLNANEFLGTIRRAVPE